MNFLSALFTGIAVSSNPQPAQADQTQPPPAVHVASIEKVPAATALTEADVDLYLHVMRGAADRIAQATGDDKAAIDFMRETKGAAAQSPESAMLERRAADLSNYDETIADEEGVKARYDSVKHEVETPKDSNQAVLAPHQSEIEALQNQVHGFMNGK